MTFRVDNTNCFMQIKIKIPVLSPFYDIILYLYVAYYLDIYYLCVSNRKK